MASPPFYICAIRCGAATPAPSGESRMLTHGGSVALGRRRYYTRIRSAPVSLHAALSHAIKRTTAFAEPRRVALALPSTDPGLVWGDEELLVKAFHTLLETAVEFSEEGEPVRIACDVGPDSVRVVIESQGRTITTSALAKFFDLFSRREAATRGLDLGLGPPVAFRILSLFSASVSVANRDESGIRLTISLRNATS